MNTERFCPICGSKAGKITATTIRGKMRLELVTFASGDANCPCSGCVQSQSRRYPAQRTGSAARRISVHNFPAGRKTPREVRD